MNSRERASDMGLEEAQVDPIRVEERRPLAEFKLA